MNLERPIVTNEYSDALFPEYFREDLSCCTRFLGQCPVVPYVAAGSAADDGDDLDAEAAVNLNFHICSMTRGNIYKLQKFACHYNLRKYSFCSRVVNIWNSLPNEVVEVDTINIFKNRLDKHWSNQEVFFNDFNANLTGTGDLPICI